MALRPRPGVTGQPYKVPRALAPTDLKLDANEGAVPDPAVVGAAADVDTLRRYPDAAPLTQRLAARLGVDPDRVLVTAGGDDALDRACRAVLSPGDTVILPRPGFEMLARYAELAGARVVSPPWDAPRYPTQAVLDAIDATTRMVVVTSPNNPNGGFATAEDLRQLSAAAPDALLLVDLAYVEFADEDLTKVALELDNALVIRTLSKAWGFAGLRVGYAVASAEIIGWLRVVGAPYAVAGPSLAIAERALDGPDLGDFIARVKAERTALEALLPELGATPQTSQGNFVFARTGSPVDWRDALAGLGIGIRAWPGKEGLDDALRITCPGDEAAFERLTAALRAWRQPQALLLDLDGVLADVSGSYRAAIEGTCAAFGVTVTPEDIRTVKAMGDANNDWVVSQRLLADRGADVPLDRVTAAFEALYQGTGDTEGLWRTETLLASRESLAALAERLPLAIVTGRPRRDAVRFLEHFDLADLFPVVVCMEDGPAKPDPAPVRTALERLGVERAWMVGDTVDDVRAARSAGVLPFGVLAPGDTDPLPLQRAGAARVLDRLTDWLELLP